MVALARTSVLCSSAPPKEEPDTHGRLPQEAEGGQHKLLGLCAFSGSPVHLHGETVVGGGGEKLGRINTSQVIPVWLLMAMCLLGPSDRHGLAPALSPVSRHLLEYVSKKFEMFLQQSA